MSAFGPSSLRKLLLFVPLTLAATVVLSGCGMGPVDTSSGGTLHMQGAVHGGQQGVSGASIRLYTVGKTGLRSAATSMLTTPVGTDRFGYFNITNDYTCASAEDQVYITSVGGNPGLAAGTNNAALVMVNALGRCGDLSATTFITINEVTTVAAAYALGAFAGNYDTIGASATNALGIRNAFLDARLLANSATGLAATLPSTQSIENDKLYAFADALAACVNSNGQTTACTSLFAAATPSGGTAPANTFRAALNIVRNPGNNVADIYNLIPPQPPFPTALTQAPNDWTMSLTISGGGLNAPTQLAVDTQGNVWVASYYGVLSAFTPQGTPYSATGYGIGTLTESFGLTIDPSGNVWVDNTEAPRHGVTKGSITKFLGVSAGASMGSIVPGNNGNYFQDASIDYPFSLSSTTSGNILIANNANASATIYNPSANTYAQIGTGGSLAFPNAIIPDFTGGFWVANNDLTVTHLDAAGNLLARLSCCDNPNSLATDSQGNVWAANYYGSSVSEISPSNTILIQQTTNGGITLPSGIAIDAAQAVWVTNFRGTSFSALAGSNAPNPALGLSPVTGFGQDPMIDLNNGMGPIPVLTEPFGIAPDRSGNLWISNFGTNTVAMFFGMATPTVTPVAPAPTAP